MVLRPTYVFTSVCDQAGIPIPTSVYIINHFYLLHSAGVGPNSRVYADFMSLSEPVIDAENS